MAVLPITHLPTIEAIYKMYRDKSSNFRRPHLGASIIGRSCSRAIWYTLRWSSDPGFEGRMLRLFESGFREEGRIITNLRALGIVVYDRDPSSGEQLHFFEESCPMFSGSVDGIAQGFAESKSWHILECKSASKRQFDLLVKNGLERQKPEYWAQVQIYMRWAGLDRAYFISCCKDDDRLYGERVYLDKEFTERLVEKARRIISSETPPEKICDDPENFQCKWCEHSEVCHHGQLPLVSCRTCSFITPNVVDGTWQCGRDNSILGEAKQKAGCDGHIFIPQLVNLEATDSDPEVGTISYGNIVNGPGAVLSKDLQKVIDEC